MSAAITVRPYASADLAAVVGLVKELQAHDLAHYPLMSPPDRIGPWYVEHLLADVAQYRGTLLVAQHGNCIAGYASLMAVVENTDKDEISHSFAYVGDLVVTERLRGHGIGQALLAECERLARAAGQKHLRLSVLAGNRSARAFYDRWGFQEHLLTLVKELP